jgi:phosphoglycerate-specific signal transduction histidine kinase
VLNIVEPRLQDIARELRQKLSLTQHMNAVSVLFRVFIELSADAYIDREKLPKNPQSKLSQKLKQVSDELIALKKLTKEQANPVRLICDKNSFLAPSTALLNDYVHNHNIFPAPTDLRAYWDGVQPFMTAIWAP